jgi:SAM-dependent methyltransferase
METGKITNRLQGWLEQLFPNWMHGRRLRRRERQWLNPEFSPLWTTDEPQKELVEAIDSGWFPKNQLILDVGCGDGRLSRWLAAKGFAVLGIDYSTAAIEKCRRLSAGHPNPPIFTIADLCEENLRLEPVFSVIDRGCFHRTVGKLRPVFARNIARATVEGGHLLLLASTFQDARVVNYSGVRSERQLCEHIGDIFGNHFVIARAESAFISDFEAVAFWMVRKLSLLVWSAVIWIFQFSDFCLVCLS